MTGTPARPARPTLAQLREVCQPPAIRGRRNSEHWVADLYGRRVSIHITRWLVRTPVSANGVTVLMTLTGIGAAAALLIPGIPGGLLAAVLAQLQMVVDSCDGEVARWRGTSSAQGVFLDRVAHYATEALVAIALGLRAAGFPGEGWLETPWPLLGALLAVLVLWNKALNDIVHVSRAYHGLPRLEDKESVGLPRSSGLRRLRSLARFVPFHRAYHSVELTLLAFAASVGDAIAGGLGITRGLLAVLTVLGVVTILGHLAAILSSSRLR